jgi:type I restriction enzyme M protein
VADKVNQKEINDVLWRACDTFRGVIDAAQYKDYILVMLFLKYLSDLWSDLKEELEKKYKGDATRVERALSRERFIVPPESHFDFLHNKRREANIGDLINIALAAIEDKNRGKLEGVFRNIDFNSEANLGKPKDRNERLRHLLEDFSDERLNLRPSRIGGLDVIGNAYEFLIGNFASDAGKKAGEFYTPPEVSMLLTKLLNPQPGNRIGDPACGSGSLLIKMGEAVAPNSKGERDVSLFGMEANGATWALCKMNMFLHGFDQARIEWCDTLRNPTLIENDALMKFDIVAANPPFSLDKWSATSDSEDEGTEIRDPKDDKPFNRFHRGVPPKSKGDYAFISHMIETTIVDTGKVGVICPHGVLFRGGQEGVIRRKLIEENLLDAVIGLPANLFYGTGIPAAILIFDRARTASKRKDVLFVDASREFAQEKRQNRLRAEDLKKIVATYSAFKSVEKYAYRATVKEIAENDYNLNIPRYVDTFEAEEEIDIDAVQEEIDGIEAELAKTRKQMAMYLKELGYGR